MFFLYAENEQKNNKPAYLSYRIQIYLIIFSKKYIYVYLIIKNYNYLYKHPKT